MTPTQTPPATVEGKNRRFFIRDKASGLYFKKLTHWHASAPCLPKSAADTYQEWEMRGVALTWYGSEAANSLASKAEFEQASPREIMQAGGRRGGASKSQRKQGASKRNGFLNQGKKR